MLGSSAPVGRRIKEIERVVVVAAAAESGDDIGEFRFCAAVEVFANVSGTATDSSQQPLL